MRNCPIKSILITVAILAPTPLLRAQTVKASGAPNPQSSSAPADLSGVWARHPLPGARAYVLYSFTKEEPPMTPWAEALFKASKPSFGPRAAPDSNDPVNPTSGNSVGCFPPGVPRIYQHPFPMEIIQTPGRVLILYEFNHFVRQIYTDGKGHDPNLAPLWMGDSIGKWEGDTLVVDTTNFNDKTWLDRGGHPHSEALHLTERIRRPDHETLEIELIIDDPKAYTKIWSAKLYFQLHPKWNIMELVCEDNANFLDLQNKLTGPKNQ